MKLNTRSLMSATWNTRLNRAAVTAIGLALVLFGSKAQAAERVAPGGGLDFGGLGTKLGQFLCDFIHSPVIAVVVGISILALLLLMTMNEDNGMLSKALKVLIGGMTILFIPPLLGMLGFDLGCS